MELTVNFCLASYCTFSGQFPCFSAILPPAVCLYLHCLYPSKPEGPVAEGGRDYILLLSVYLRLDVLADAALAAFTRDGFFSYGARRRHCRSIKVNFRNNECHEGMFGLCSERSDVLGKETVFLLFWMHVALHLLFSFLDGMISYN